MYAGGSMTNARRSLLKRWRNFQALRTAGFLLALIGLLYICGRMIAGTGEGFEPLLALALLVWTLWLSMAPAAWLAAHQDLKSGVTDTVEGAAILRQRRGIGLIAPTRTRLIVGRRRFDISDSLANHLVEGRSVRVTFGRQSGALVSVDEIETRGRDWPGPQPAPREPLSEKEKAILRLIAKGLSDKEIARELGLSPATIRTYNTTLYAKLGVARRTQAAPYAAALGLLD